MELVLNLRVKIKLIMNLIFLPLLSKVIITDVSRSVDNIISLSKAYLEENFFEK